MFITLSGVLSADVAPNGTLVVSLPTAASVQNLSNFQAIFPVTGGDFINGFSHKLSLNGTERVFGGGDALSFPQDFEVTLAASTATITNRTGVAWKAGSGYRLQLDGLGSRYYQDNDPAFSRKTVKAVDVNTLLINLGMPAATLATSVAAAQAVAGAGNLSLDGASVVAGVAYNDVPRNLTIVSSAAGDTTQTATIFGLDQYGVPLRESLTFNGTTTVQGNKAFASVSRVSISGVMAGNASVGRGDKLGLPVHLASSGFVLKELLDGANATAGTFVAGIRVKSTATSGDVRGTYVPNSAPNGSRTYQILAATPDAGNLGAPQFNG